jgi:FMN reductase
MAQIVALAGSPSPASRSTGVLEHARTLLARHQIATTLIQVRDLPAEDLLFGRFDSPAIQQAGATLSEAQVVIVATPIYKAAYSGVLKAFLDLLPSQSLANKVILPIATGASPTHLLAIGYALNPVLAELGATTILGGMYILDSQIQRTDDASFVLDEAIEQRLQRSLQDVVLHIQLREERNNAH